MEIGTFEDCFVHFDEKSLAVGNSRIRRDFRFTEAGLVPVSLVNRTTGRTWGRQTGPWVAMAALPCVPFHGIVPHVSWNVDDAAGLTEPRLRATVEYADGSYTVRIVLTVHPDLPFLGSRMLVKGPQLPQDWHPPAPRRGQFGNIETQPAPAEEGYLLPPMDTVDSVNLDERHLRLQVCRLHDVTDYFDHLVETLELSAYHRRPHTYAGNVLLISAYLEDEGLLVVKDGPTPEAHLARRGGDFVLQPSARLHVCGTGIDYSRLEPEEFHTCYGATLGVGAPAQLPSLYRRLYRSESRLPYLDRSLLTSNTWGDRSKDTALSESFMLQEIETAKRLGVPVVCIDDGWEHGVTTNSARADGAHIWEGYWSSDPDFWRVDRERFPNGLDPLVTAAKNAGVELSLWFGPDSANDFENWEKDAGVLLDFYRRYGIRVFKLDGIKLRSKRGERNLVRMLDRLHSESGGAIVPCMDCTAEIRLGYLYEKRHGLIFVENRYTDWGNYYPHNTLKNLWLLSRWVPTRRLQTEVLNLRRNAQVYGDTDPLAPVHYRIDYAYAVSIVSNPLIWMEISHLAAEDMELLARVIRVHRNEMDRLWDADVFPVGAEPDGTSFTGFHAVTAEDSGYLVLFREWNDTPEATIRLPALAKPIGSLAVLYVGGNGNDARVAPCGEGSTAVRVRFDEPRSFVFARYGSG